MIPMEIRLICRSMVGRSNRSFAGSHRLRYALLPQWHLPKKYAGLVIVPGGLGTLDELFEALTLIQTEKIKPFPVILVGSAYWNGLVKWLHDPVLKEGKITPQALQIFSVVDTPEEVIRIIQTSTPTHGGC